MSKQNLIDQIMNIVFPQLRAISRDEEDEQTKILLKNCTFPKFAGMTIAPFTAADRIRLGVADNYGGTWHACDLNDPDNGVDISYIHTKSGRKFTTRVPLADIPEAVERHKAVVELEKSTKNNRADVEKRLSCLSAKEICSTFDIDLKKFVLNGLTEQQIQAIRDTFN